MRQMNLGQVSQKGQFASSEISHVGEICCFALNVACKPLNKLPYNEINMIFDGAPWDTMYFPPTIRTRSSRF